MFRAKSIPSNYCFSLHHKFHTLCCHFYSVKTFLNFPFNFVFWPMGHLKVCNLISRYLGFVQINLLLISNLDPLWSENVSCMSFITPSCSQTEIQSHILGLARCFYLLCYEKQYWGKDELGILVPILQYFLRQIPISKNFESKSIHFLL